MAWRLVVQPNGKIARFSEVVDHFTDLDMTADEAVTLCIQQYTMSLDEAHVKLGHAVHAEATRWNEALDIIRAQHGESAIVDLLDTLTTKETTDDNAQS